MNPIDRRVAELKGFTKYSSGYVMGKRLHFVTAPDGSGLRLIDGFAWTQDIASAFELVDEAIIENERLTFDLSYCIDDEKPYWKASFSLDKVALGFSRSSVKGETIALAWIDLKENWSAIR